MPPYSPHPPISDVQVRTTSYREPSMADLAHSTCAKLTSCPSDGFIFLLGALGLVSPDWMLLEGRDYSFPTEPLSQRLNIQ